MNESGEIRAERERLLARAAVEREHVSAQLRAWEAPLALVDRSVAAVRCVRRHPEWLVAAAVVLAILRPRRALAWARNGLLAWRAWRWVTSSRLGRAREALRAAGVTGSRARASG